MGHEAELYQFDFKSHHALQPAAQLNFPSKKLESIVHDNGLAKQPNVLMKQSNEELHVVQKERRIDPLDGRVYRFEELQRYYRHQYSEPEILTYWHKECILAPVKRLGRCQTRHRI